LFWEGQIGLELPKTTKRDAKGIEWEIDVWAGSLAPPQPTRGFGERELFIRGSIVSSCSGVWGRAPAANDFGHYTRNFVRLHACFSALWNLTGKANKTDPIRALLPAIGLEWARAPCAPHLDPPMQTGQKH